MPNICPRPCSRLATAAVFISVGVVQFVVGIILLRSKFVYLLAMPDFWTSCSNIAVGCLLGATASVWKESKKRRSSKYVIRRNVLLALMFSALMINSTTLGILLLSEANTLLSIQLESDGQYSNTTFVSEVLAYAYATSVCSPIVCIVVSIVAMSGSCFNSSDKDHTKMKTPLNSLKKDRSQSFQWVYTPEMLAMAKKKSSKNEMSSSDSSSESSEEVLVQQKYANSVEDLERVLQRMAQGKRDSILNDSTAMVRQMERLRKDKYSSQIQDGSYLGPSHLRTKYSRAEEAKSARNGSNYSRNGKSYRHSFAIDGNADSESIGDVLVERVANRKSTRPIMSYRSPYTTDEVFKEYQNQNASSQLVADNFTSYPRNFKGNSLIGSEMLGVKKKYGSEEELKLKSMASVHKAGIKLPIAYTNPRDLTVDHHGVGERHEASRENRDISEKKNSKSHKVSMSKEIDSPLSNDGSSPNGSDSADSSEVARANSWAGEVIPINVKSNNPPPPPVRSSKKLTPVPSPVVPDRQEVNFRKSSRNTESLSDEELNSDSLKLNLSSFHNEEKARKESTEEYPKVSSQSVKRCDLARVLKMSSISEEPDVDACKFSADASRYEKQSTSKEQNSYSNKKSLSSTYSESPRVQYSDAESPGQSGIPKRKKSSSCKTLRRIWSSYGSERDMDFLQNVVDQDSLIGLSEEELIARQTRTRSIRKAVQQRIKEKELAF